MEFYEGAGGVVDLFIAPLITCFLLQLSALGLETGMNARLTKIAVSVPVQRVCMYVCMGV